MTQKGEAQEGFPFYGEGDVSTLHVDSVPAVRFPMLEWSFMTPGLATRLGVISKMSLSTLQYFTFALKSKANTKMLH